jgi:subtilisin family serine protease
MAVTQITKTDANGRVKEVDTYSENALTEIDTYSYLSNGQLLTILKRNGQGTIFESDSYYNGRLSSVNKYNEQGTIFESDSYYNGQLSTVNKYNGQGKIIESDYYTNGLLSQVSNINAQGMGTLDSYKYTNGQLSSISKTNSKGVVVEVDKFSNGNVEIDSYTNGVISQATFKNALGNVYETDLYRYNGYQLSSIVKSNAQGETYQIDYYGLNTSLYNYGYFIKEKDYYRNGVIYQIVLNDKSGNKVETDTYQYTNGQVSSITKFNAQGVMTETDKYSAGVLIEVDKYLGNNTEYDTYVNGVLTQGIIKNAKGIVIETDAYQYSAGVLSTVTKIDASGQKIGFDSYTYSGSNVLLTSNQYANNVLTQKTNYVNGQISAVTKYNNGKVFELDTYSSGSLFAVTKFSNNQIVEMDKYSKGVVSEIDNYFYNNGKLATVIKADPFGKIIATDTYYGSAYVESYPNTTINGEWSSHFGYGAADVLLALSSVLGTSVTDVAAPTYIQSQWDLTTMHFDDAWAMGYTGKGIVIADIDTGIDLNNTALTQHLSPYSWNFVDNNSNVQDKNGHGTGTASEMIAANTGGLVTGAAYDASLMVLKALNDSGKGSAANIAAAIRYAVDHGADVINLSLGGLSPLPTVQQALAYADAHGVVSVIAAGNYGIDDPLYPALYAEKLQNVIAVGATANTTQGLALSYFSNEAGSTTPYNFVNAPGSNVTLFGLNNTVNQWNGTSMAAPLVAAEVAVLLSVNSTLTSQQIVDDVVHTASLSLVGVASSNLGLLLA